MRGKPVYGGALFPRSRDQYLLCDQAVAERERHRTKHLAIRPREGRYRLRSDRCDREPTHVGRLNRFIASTAEIRRATTCRIMGDPPCLTEQRASLSLIHISEPTRL